MPGPKMTIHNYQKIGELIKTWASDEKKRPATKEDLLAMANDDGLNLELADEVTTVVYTDVPEEQASEIRFVIPANNALSVGVEEDLYPLPTFYAENAFLDPEQRVMDDDETEAFRTMRIGEYTTSKCK
ncbi:MAG: hypothetical protein AAF495_19555 [Pseudomonadota bacterium]